MTDATLQERISTLMADKEAKSRLSMGEIIDRMAEALYVEHYRNKRPTKWATLMEGAALGKTAPMTTVAKWRRMARKAHTAYHAAVDERQ